MGFQLILFLWAKTVRELGKINFESDVEIDIVLFLLGKKKRVSPRYFTSLFIYKLTNFYFRQYFTKLVNFQCLHTIRLCTVSYFTIHTSQYIHNSSRSPLSNRLFPGSILSSQKSHEAKLRL